MSFSIKPDPNGTKTELVHGSKVGLTLTSLGAFLDNDAEQDMQPVTLRQASAMGSPPGAITAFAMVAPPTGWLSCTGQAVGRTTYPRLFAAIGTTFGVGDGVSTFNLPDLRGEFIRGWDEGRGADPGRSFGSWQIDMLKSHNHETLKGNSEGDNGSTFTNGWGPDNPPVPTSYTGGTETRPRNVALRYCIKT